MRCSLVLNGNVLVCVCERGSWVQETVLFGCQESYKRKSRPNGGEADILTAGPREPFKCFSSCTAARGSRKGGTRTHTEQACPSTLFFPLGIRQTEGGGLKSKDI